MKELNESIEKKNKRIKTIFLSSVKANQKYMEFYGNQKGSFIQYVGQHKAAPDSNTCMKKFCV